MRVKRSLTERTKASLDAWMPMDAKQAVLLGVIALLLLILVPLLH
jgi:hypothetical protein